MSLEEISFYWSPGKINGKTYFSVEPSSTNCCEKCNTLNSFFYNPFCLCVFYLLFNAIIEKWYNNSGRKYIFTIFFFIKLLKLSFIIVNWMPIKVKLLSFYNNLLNKQHCMKNSSFMLKVYRRCYFVEGQMYFF